MQLFTTLASDSLIECGKIRMEPPLWNAFVSHASLNADRILMIMIDSLRSKKCAFIYNLTHFASFEVQLETLPTYFEEYLAFL